MAFHGRAGNALMKSFQTTPSTRPLSTARSGQVPGRGSDPADPECVARLADEMGIVQPRIVVVMGEPALETINSLLPCCWPVRSSPAKARSRPSAPPATPLYPDIDGALDEETAKRRFWRAFRTLGRWHDDLPVLTRPAPAPAGKPPRFTAPPALLRPARFHFAPYRHKPGTR